MSGGTVEWPGAGVGQPWVHKCIWHNERDGVQEARKQDKDGDWVEVLVRGIVEEEEE